VLRLESRAHPPDRRDRPTPQDVALPVDLQVLADLSLAIDPDEVLRFQGYKKGRDVPTADVRTLLDAALAEGEALMAPRAVARWLPVATSGADTLVVGDETLAIPDTGERWGRVEHVAAAVCTIGEALERRVAALWEARELPLAAMLDSVGSGAVESLAEYVNDVLCAQGLAAGLRVTNRISPGYAGWDVAEQRALFRLCPGARAGVTLNEACVMTPGKSISLLVGAGVAARVDHYFSQCARCWMAGCAYRRAPARRTVHR
jgi:cobalamin-dependent methionine synthase I